jgi:cytochrome b561
VALLVLGMIPAGFIMVQEGISRPLQNSLFLFHKNVGLLVFLLVVVRALYRWRKPPAPLPEDMPGWQRTAAGLSHGALYLLLLLMPIAGYIRVKAGGFPIESLDAMGLSSLVPRSDALAETAKSFHYFGGIAIACIVAVHISAAAYHGLVSRDGVFARMWPPVGRGSI